MRTGFYRFVGSLLMLFAGVTAHSEARMDFNLPSQSLGDALRALGTRLEINVLFEPSNIEDKPAPALKMTGTLDEALARLLAGSGVVHRRLNSTTIVLVATGPAARTQSEATPRAPMAWLRVIEGRRARYTL